MSVTDEIKSRIDIVSYVQRHVPALKKAGRNHKACCPFHSRKDAIFCGQSRAPKLALFRRLLGGRRPLHICAEDARLGFQRGAARIGG